LENSYSHQRETIHGRFQEIRRNLGHDSNLLTLAEAEALRQIESGILSQKQIKAKCDEQKDKPQYLRDYFERLKSEHKSGEACFFCAREFKNKSEEDQYIENIRDRIKDLNDHIQTISDKRAIQTKLVDCNAQLAKYDLMKRLIPDYHKGCQELKELDEKTQANKREQEQLADNEDVLASRETEHETSTKRINEKLKAAQELSRIQKVHSFDCATRIF
jgi:hypothetical protein